MEKYSFLINPSKIFTEEICILCYENTCVPNSILKCGHMVSIECIKTYLIANKCCPMCKEKYTGHKK